MTALAYDIGQYMTWPAVADADRYDVVKGLLSSLQSTGGDFASSIGACLENDGADQSASDGDTPLYAGDGIDYLVGARNSCKDGTYESGSSTQAGERDAEIASSGDSRP